MPSTTDFILQSFFDSKHSKPPGIYLWQEIFKSPQTFIFFLIKVWADTVKNCRDTKWEAGGVMNYVLLVDTNDLLGKQVSKTLGFLDSWVLEMRKNKRQIRPRKRKCNKKLKRQDKTQAHDWKFYQPSHEYYTIKKTCYRVILASCYQCGVHS